MGPDLHPAGSSGWRNWPRRWQAISAAGALVVILLVGGALVARLDLSGGQALVTATKTPQLPPTTVLTPIAGLDWHAESLPPDVSLGVLVTGKAQADFALSPSRGRRAWICAPTTSGQVNVWATQDLGASWQLASALTPVTPEPIGSCRLVAATSDPDLIVLEVEWGGGESHTLRMLSYVSTDGGAHWRLVPGKTDVRMVDHVGGATFALLVDTTLLTDPNQHAILVVSHDALTTWRSITPPDLAAYGQVFRFWAQPTTGQLLAATLGAALGPTLWHSEDGGEHWARVPTAKSQIDQALWLPQAQRWLLCAQALCSEDLGATWNTVATVRCPVQGLTIDGALITVCPDTLREISRHLIGSTSVTSLGTTPWPLTFVAPTGELWSLAGQQASVAVLPLVAS